MFTAGNKKQCVYDCKREKVREDCSHEGPEGQALVRCAMISFYSMKSEKGYDVVGAMKNRKRRERRRLWPGMKKYMYT